MNTIKALGLESLVNPDSNDVHQLRPHYENSHKGVQYIGLDGNGDYAPPVRLADPIAIIGRGRDDSGQHYRLIEWRRDGKTCHDALPMADIGTPACWARLQGHGITIHAGRRKRELLADYLQGEGSRDNWHITARAGWHEGAYILPSGEVLGGERIHYHGDTSQAAYYRERGSLEEWKAHIARYANGNSRLTLAIGCALAAPLLRLLDINGGGFHLYGDSSCGKTTAAKVALSVWGNPDELTLTWEGTSHGFSNTAAARNDGLLVLDEIGQARPHVVAQTAYSVINGIGKIQGHKDGGNRAITKWRVLLLSTGEKTLEGFAGQWEAGQATRLPSIPADAGKKLGIYDTLHDHSTGQELSEYLTDAASRYHGTAGRAFIAELMKDTAHAKEAAREAMKGFYTGKLGGQAHRVAQRFAAVYAALTLARPQLGIDPEPVRQCFHAWKELEGTGNRESRIIIERAADFMQQNGTSPRFAPWGATQTFPDHAGYRNGDEYWIIPPVFKAEICGTASNAEVRRVCETLHGIGWLKKRDKNRYPFQRQDGTRCYVLIGITPPEGWDDD